MSASASAAAFDDDDDVSIRKKALRAAAKIGAAGELLSKNNFALLDRLADRLSAENEDEDEEEVEIILLFLINASSKFASSPEDNNKKSGSSVVVVIDPFVARSLVNCQKLLRSLILESCNRRKRQQRRKIRKLSLMLLSNLTIDEDGCAAFLESIDNSTNSGEDFLRSICRDMVVEIESVPSTNPDSDLPVYAAYLIRNLTQSTAIRRRLVIDNWSECFGAILVPPAMMMFQTAGGSSSSDQLEINNRGRLRSTVADIVRNCCLDESLHDSMIFPHSAEGGSSHQHQLLTSLLFPLLGGEELDEDENEALPLELQYAETEKRREPIAAIRIAILEALYQLCATSKVREYLRRNGTYYVLREYHKWERKLIEDGETAGERAEILCANVIGVLIRYEQEIGCDNLKLVGRQEAGVN